jgi:hypothetical protein
VRESAWGKWEVNACEKGAEHIRERSGDSKGGGGVRIVDYSLQALKPVQWTPYYISRLWAPEVKDNMIRLSYQ